MQGSVLADWQSFTKLQTGKAKAAGIAQVSSECPGEGADKMNVGEEESCDRLPGLPAARAAAASGSVELREVVKLIYLEQEEWGR